MKEKKEGSTYRARAVSTLQARGVVVEYDVTTPSTAYITKHAHAKERSSRLIPFAAARLIPSTFEFILWISVFTGTVDDIVPFGVRQQVGCLRAQPRRRVRVSTLVVDEGLRFFLTLS